MKTSDICKMLGVNLKNTRKVNRMKWKDLPLPIGGEECENLLRNYELENSKYFYGEFDEWDGYYEDTYSVYRSKKDPTELLLRHDNYMTGGGHDYWYMILSIEEV